MNPLIVDGGIKLRGTGRALPGSPLDNDTLLNALGNFCDTNAVRRARAIGGRLGIQSRHLSRDLDSASGTMRDGVSAPELCRSAIATALSAADADIGDIDYLIGHTASPHTLLPPNVAWVADELSLNSPYMELRQACTGFANALQVAQAMIKANQQHCLAIVGSETGSPFFTADDEFASTEQLVNYMQMGDGAGAVVLGPDDGSGQGIITDLFMGHIGIGREPGLSLRGGGSGDPYCRFDLPVFEHRATAVRESGPALFERGLAAIESRGYILDDFDFVIPHQANGRMASLLSRHLGIAETRVYGVADRYGNLGSAAIWVALDDLITSSRLRRGDKVLILGAEATKFLYGGFVYTH